MESLYKSLVEDTLTPGDIEMLKQIRTGDYSDGSGFHDSNNEIVEDNFWRRKFFEYDLTLRKQSLKRCIERKLDAYYMDKLNNSDDLNELLPILKEIRADEEKNDNVKSSRFCFITFSPNSVVGVFDLIKLVDKLIKLQYVKKYLYVVEQRYDGGDKGKLGDGLHIHLLIDKGDYRFSHLKRDVQRIFKNMICNIDYSLRRETDVAKTQKYMVGDKKDEYKQLKQVQDKLYRQQMGLRDYYGELFVESLG